MPYTLPPNAKNAFHSQRLDCWQWEQELYDGSTAIFECVTRKDSASVIAFLDPNTILLTEQNQPGRISFIDAAGGVIEPNETPEEAAKREFFEETGYEIGKLELFQRYDSTGQIRFSTHIFLATDLKKTAEQHLDAGERITLRPTPFDEAVQLSLKRSLRQHGVMLTILALALDPEAKQQLSHFLK